MINGQKVVNVFCHEEKSKEEFDQLNEALRFNSSAANQFTNIIGPINNNLGHFQYVLLAVIGGMMAIGGVGGMTLGGIASFLQLSKSFNMPVNQVSQQLNSIVMALAGAERIFAMMDERSEEDEGKDDSAQRRIPKRRADGSTPAHRNVGVEEAHRASLPR